MVDRVAQPLVHQLSMTLTGAKTKDVFGIATLKQLKLRAVESSKILSPGEPLVNH